MVVALGEMNSHLGISNIIGNIYKPDITKENIHQT